MFSAGMIGYQVELPLPALKTVIPLTTALSTTPSSKPSGRTEGNW